MSADDDALASIERATIAELLENGFLHVQTFTGRDGGERLSNAGRLKNSLETEGREATILHCWRVTRVYAKRPKRAERYPA